LIDIYFGKEGQDPRNEKGRTGGPELTKGHWPSFFLLIMSCRSISSRWDPFLALINVSGKMGDSP